MGSYNESMLIFAFPGLAQDGSSIYPYSPYGVFALRGKLWRAVYGDPQTMLRNWRSQTLNGIYVPELSENGDRIKRCGPQWFVK